MSEQETTRWEAALAKGNLKGALRGIENELFYGALPTGSLGRIEVVAKRIAEEGNAKQQKKAHALIAKTRQIEQGRERAAQAGREAAERAKRREEEQYRSIAKERLDTLHATRGTRDITSPRSFEYAVMELPRQETAEHLNKAGSLGWELVSALSASDEQHVLYMKRDAWLATDKSSGRLVANAVPVAATGAAAAAGGMAFAGFYHESGPDFDGDGVVDGGLFDNIGNLFG